jgi:hypothetical protein
VAAVTGQFSYDPEARLLTVGDRRFPAQVADEHWDRGAEMDGRVIFRSRRVRIPMENGYQLSIVWGSGSYSDNYDWPHSGEWVEEPERVECAVFAPAPTDGVMVDVDGDCVVGWATVEHVQRLILLVSALSTSRVPERLSLRPDVTH